jgi:predicted transposase YdaD
MTRSLARTGSENLHGVAHEILGHESQAPLGATERLRRTTRGARSGVRPASAAAASLPQPVNRPPGQIQRCVAPWNVRLVSYDGIMTRTPPDSRTNTNPDTQSAPASSPAGSESLSQPHDGFFKSIFNDPVHAAAELRAILPARVSRHIDWNGLQTVHASFVDAALSQRHGDLMFSARLVEGHEVYLWLLFEHQSTMDRWMPLRVLEMVVEFLKGWRKEHPEARRLPAILPIVLYQGATPWSAPCTLAELYDLSDQALRDLSDFLLSLRFLLDDLRVTPDDELIVRPVDDLVRVALVVMKHVTSEHLLALLMRLADEIARLMATEQGRIGLSGIVWYIHCVHPTLDRFAILQALSPIVGPELVTTMETYEQALERLYIEKVTRKAKNEGVQEGEQKILLRQLARRFGALPEAVTARVMRASGEELERWSDRILDAASLDDVFASP